MRGKIGINRRDRVSIHVDEPLTNVIFVSNLAYYQHFIQLRLMDIKPLSLQLAKMKYKLTAILKYEF